MTTSESRPSSAARTASSWPGRKARKPKCWWSEEARSIGPATLAPGPADSGAPFRGCNGLCGVGTRVDLALGDDGRFHRELAPRRKRLLQREVAAEARVAVRVA